MNFLKGLSRSRPSVPGVRHKEHEVTDGNDYDVYTAPDRATALQFLRSLEIREERKYVIVETPEVTLGKDLIMIFDERSSELVEYGVRKPLPSPRRSATHCTSCGYSVLPARAAAPGVKDVLVLDHLKSTGIGFLCRECQAAWCPFCVNPENPGVCPSCVQAMDVVRE